MSRNIIEIENISSKINNKNDQDVLTNGTEVNIYQENLTNSTEEVI